MWLIIFLRTGNKKSESAIVKNKFSVNFVGL